MSTPLYRQDRTPDIRYCPEEWLVPLLCEHVLTGLRRASGQIERHDGGARASLERTSVILLDLLGALDTSSGDETVEWLARFCIGEVMAVSRTLDGAHLARTIGMIEDLRGVWTEASRQVLTRYPA